MDEMHAHPLDAEEVIRGRLLRVGEEMQKDDVYDSITGTWVPVPSVFIGNTVLPTHGILIRPTK